MRLQARGLLPLGLHTLGLLPGQQLLPFGLLALRVGACCFLLSQQLLAFSFLALRFDALRLLLGQLPQSCGFFLALRLETRRL